MASGQAGRRLPPCVPLTLTAFLPFPSATFLAWVAPELADQATNENQGAQPGNAPESHAWRPSTTRSSSLSPRLLPCAPLLLLPIPSDSSCLGRLLRFQDAPGSRHLPLPQRLLPRMHLLHHVHCPLHARRVGGYPRPKSVHRDRHNAKCAPACDGLWPPPLPTLRSFVPRFPCRLACLRHSL